jgi:NADH-quinone oxidoreductase subunit L
MFESLQTYFAHAPVDPQTMARSLWLIIGLPALGALICGVFGKSLGRANTHLVAVCAIAGSLFLSILVLWTLNDRDAARFESAYAEMPVRYALGYDYGTWFAVGGFRVNFGLFVDHLSGTLLMVITGVGLLIHIYSTSYMEHDDGYWRFFAYLNLFVAMMLTLVLADSLVLLFVGWEGVGMCSYLLIGFWYTDSAKAFAGRKAFITNRIGDFGFLLAAFLLVLWVGAFSDQNQANPLGANVGGARLRQGIYQKGTLNFRALEEVAKTLHTTTARGIPNGVQLDTTIAAGPLAGKTFGGVLTVILLLFLLGASGKSAQIPLYVWLPDAMAGPTPVSALIHAATMVTAGVYLFCRMSYLLVLSPTAMAITALIGGTTALFAALIAFAQTDIKKVLAYSTVSQLGLMFLGVGMGVFWAAVLHLVTHAFFKACLFLGAGSVMHGNGDETDITKLGGVRREMKVTWATFAIATLAATGLVPLSGFFSKDAILHGVHSTHLQGFHWVTNVGWILGLATALCTAFYMVRLYWLTFEGRRSPNALIPHAHESAWPMTVPLVILAGASVLALFHGVPLMRSREGGLEPVMQNYLTPVFDTAQSLVHSQKLMEVHHTEGLPWFSWILAWGIALTGGALAWFLYARLFPSRAMATDGFPGMVRRWALNKFYVDELYERVIIRPLKGISFLLFRVVDTVVIDLLGVRGTAWVTQRTGSMLRYFQTGDVQSYAAFMAIALLAGVAYAVFRVIG